MALFRCGAGDTFPTYDGYTCVRNGSTAKTAAIVNGTNTITADNTARSEIVMSGKNVATLSFPANTTVWVFKKDGTVENGSTKTYSGDDVVCAVWSTAELSVTFAATLKA